jgi:hypothetical protein
VGIWTSAFWGFRQWPMHLLHNGLSDKTWVPVFCVDRRIVITLLTELGRAGIPVRCERLRVGWRLPPGRDEWCLWVGYQAYGPAQERLAEVLPPLLRSLRRGIAPS